MIIQTKSISRRSLFKLLIVGFGLGSLFFWLLLSLLSMYVSGSLSWEIESASGLGRFIETLTFWPFFAVLWAAFTWLILILGLAVINRFSILTLRTKD